MCIMYPSLAKNPAFPLISRVSSTPSCFNLFHAIKFQSLPVDKVLGGFHYKAMEMSSVVMGARNFGCFRLRIVSRGFSGSFTKRVGEGSFPWLVSNKGKRERGIEKAIAKTVCSSWAESVQKLEGVGRSSSFEVPANRLEKRIVRNNSTIETISRTNIKDIVGDKKGSFQGEEENEGLDDESEVVDDPRWDKIKTKFGVGKGKPEFQRWNKQENWGRKVWKEASESSVPKMTGEAVYGVAPVLAALSAGRREFYALYVQEGLNLSGNNKKKDKKGIEKVLKIAQRVELNIKEVSKHDLNMVADNRPHQGFLLDASPLELVKIKELDPVLPEEGEKPLWVALDEVTDPQNLGAIIRSAYFFGVSGVVLCAKNSAPLSGVVSKASAGSLEVMELRYCKNMMQFLLSSAENGWRVIGGSVSSKAVPLSKILPGEPTILVLGSEGSGLRPLVERSCTQLVKISGNIPSDMATGENNGDDEVEETSMRLSTEDFRSFLAVESLNVSVAAGVLLNHLVGNNQVDNQLGGDKSTELHE